MLDTPTEGRSSRAFKPYFENAGKTIFIDHHPLKQAEWANAKEKLGFDMGKAIQDKLALVVDSVPAATQIVTAVCAWSASAERLQESCRRNNHTGRSKERRYRYVCHIK